MSYAGATSFPKYSMFSNPSVTISLELRIFSILIGDEFSLIK